MKKTLGILIILICIFTCAGCSSKTTAEQSNGGFQLAYDTSERAKEWGETLLSKRLAGQNIENYKIEHTAYGFITDEPPVFIVAFQYSYGNENDIYGYRFQLNDKEEFTVNDEGAETAKVILNHPLP